MATTRHQSLIVLFYQSSLRRKLFRSISVQSAMHLRPKSHPIDGRWNISQLIYTFAFVLFSIADKSFVTLLDTVKSVMQSIASKRRWRKPSHNAIAPIRNGNGAKSCFAPRRGDIDNGISWIQQAEFHCVRGDQLAGGWLTNACFAGWLELTVWLMMGAISQA